MGIVGRASSVPHTVVIGCELIAYAVSLKNTVYRCFNIGRVEVIRNRLRIRLGCADGMEHRTERATLLELRVSGINLVDIVSVRLIFGDKTPDMFDHSSTPTSGRPATEVKRESTAARAAELATSTQFTSPIATAVPMVATAVCARVLTARIPAALNQVFQFFIAIILSCLGNDFP
jgi:hypothetical protein